MHKTSGKLHKTPRLQQIILNDLELTTASIHSAGKGQDFPSHQHSAWELIYYCTGQIQCVVSERAYYTQPGMILVIPPKTVHFDLALTAYKQFYVHVQSEVRQAWPQIHYDDAERTFFSLFANLAREWRGRAHHRSEMLTLLLQQLNLLLSRKRGAPECTAAERLVQAAERLLEERMSLAPSIKDIAAEVGVSPSTLRAYFVKLRGHPPKVHLHQLRQQRALELISSSNLSLAAIAELCGYDSASHLSRFIKRDTGYSPGTFRPPLEQTHPTLTDV